MNLLDDALIFLPHEASFSTSKAEMCKDNALLISQVFLLSAYPRFTKNPQILKTYPHKISAQGAVENRAVNCGTGGLAALNRTLELNFHASAKIKN